VQPLLVGLGTCSHCHAAVEA
ncbi:hypothetical protein D030_4384B, partial [Vibrio parahaemolyticus AQ3810]